MTTVYPKWIEAVIQASPNSSLGGNIKFLLIDTGAYTYSAAHDFLDDVAAGSRIAVSPNVSGKTYTNGEFKCSPFTFPTVTGTSCEAILAYIDTGTEATSRLVFYSTDQDGLPITPNGQDIPYTPDSSPDYIFKLNG